MKNNRLLRPGSLGVPINRTLGGALLFLAAATPAFSQPAPESNLDRLEIIPKDGMRRRFHAMLRSGKLQLVSDVDRFPSGQPIVLTEDLSEVQFQLESDNPTSHVAQLHLSGLTPGGYTIRGARGGAVPLEIQAGQETIVGVPMDAGSGPRTLTPAKLNGAIRR